jgi:hypothetical protein
MCLIEPMADPVAHQLRVRAAVLRTLASSISTCDAVELRRRAGDDVWIGPTAARCHDDLTALGRRLVDAAEQLTQRARLLDRRAAELEVLAAATTVR